MSTPLSCKTLLSHLVATSLLLACGSSPPSGESAVGPGNQPIGSGSTGGGTVVDSGGSIQLQMPPDDGSNPETGTGGTDGANAAVQCNGKFTGRLRDFTVADADGKQLDATAVPPIAEAIAGVNYVASPDFEFADRRLNPSPASPKMFGPDPGLVSAALGTDQTPV
ncbi:MAG TPA: hypothetical protein VEQ59_18260, partial [Polyangiaceae bacterium]|nr:hypothetical protein [Polyangiaceae bacterium]